MSYKETVAATAYRHKYYFENDMPLNVSDGNIRHILNNLLSTKFTHDADLLITILGLLPIFIT